MPSQRVIRLNGVALQASSVDITGNVSISGDLHVGDDLLVDGDQTLQGNFDMPSGRIQAVAPANASHQFTASGTGGVGITVGSAFTVDGGGVNLPNVTVNDLTVEGDLGHSGTNFGLYGVAPAPRPAGAPFATAADLAVSLSATGIVDNT